MLIITRREGEKLYINGKEIKITILHSTDGKVKLGIEASPDVPIFREELYERIEAEKLSHLMSKNQPEILDHAV